MVDEILNQLIPYMVLFVVGTMMFNYLMMRRMGDQYNGFVGDCRAQVKDLSKKLGAVQDKLYSQSEQHTQDWRTWYQDRSKLQDEINRLRTTLEKTMEDYAEARERWQEERAALHQEIGTLRARLDAIIVFRDNAESTDS